MYSNNNNIICCILYMPQLGHAACYFVFDAYMCILCIHKAHTHQGYFSRWEPIGKSLHHHLHQLVADIRPTSLPTALSLSRHELTFVRPLFLVAFCLSINDDYFCIQTLCVSPYLLWQRAGPCTDRLPLQIKNESSIYLQ